MDKNKKIYIAGHCGMVGSAVWRCLESNGYSNLIGKTSCELDLRNQKEVDYLVGDPTKAKVKLGWKPEYNIASLVSEMIKSDLKSFKNN